LHWACIYDEPNVVEYLVNKNASLVDKFCGSIDYEGLTPLEIAQKKKNDKIIQLLTSKPTQVHKPLSKSASQRVTSKKKLPPTPISSEKTKRKKTTHAEQKTKLEATHAGQITKLEATHAEQITKLEKQVELLQNQISKQEATHVELIKKIEEQEATRLKLIEQFQEKENQIKQLKENISTEQNMNESNKEEVVEEVNLGWRFSENLFSSNQWSRGSEFQTMEITQEGEFNVDWNYVVSLWKKHSDPDLSSQLTIQKIVAVKNDNLQQVWERLFTRMQVQIQHSAFQNTQWLDKGNKEKRKQILARLQKFQIVKEEGVCVVPLWHGTTNNKDTIDSICATGFASLAFTDDGFFGKGIYGSPQAEYSSRVYGRGVCFLCFAFIGNAFPVLHSDMPNLAGSANFGNCDAHYAPVVPKNRANTNEKVYIAMKPEDNDPVYDEFVIFNRAHMIPRFIVYYELQK